MSGPSKLQERLTAYHDEQLSADEAAAVERMLADEPDAQAFVRDATAADALLRAAGEAAAQAQFDLPELKRRTLDRVEAAPAPGRMKAFYGRRPFLRGLALGAVAAAALVLVSVTGFLAGYLQQVRAQNDAAQAAVVAASKEIAKAVAGQPAGPSAQRGKPIPDPENPSVQPIPNPDAGPAPTAPAPVAIDPPPIIQPPFVADRPVLQPIQPAPIAPHMAAAPVVIDPPPVVDVAALETLRALRSSQTVLTWLASADPLELTAWTQLVEQMDSARLLSELREAKARAKVDSPLRRCLVTLEVILLRARHARRLDARVAVQEAIRETEMLETVRQLQTAAAGDSS